jgi:hypothetical protein
MSLINEALKRVEQDKLAVAPTDCLSDSGPRPAVPPPPPTAPQPPAMADILARAAVALPRIDSLPASTAQTGSHGVLAARLAAALVLLALCGLAAWMWRSQVGPSEGLAQFEPPLPPAKALHPAQPAEPQAVLVPPPQAISYVVFEPLPTADASAAPAGAPAAPQPALTPAAPPAAAPQAPAAAPAARRALRAEDFKLSGVLEGEQAVAIINGQWLHVGEQIDGATLTRISQREVQLSLPSGGLLVLRL